MNWFLVKYIIYKQKLVKWYLNIYTLLFTIKSLKYVKGGKIHNGIYNYYYMTFLCYILNIIDGIKNVIIDQITKYDVSVEKVELERHIKGTHAYKKMIFDSSKLNMQLTLCDAFKLPYSQNKLSHDIFTRFELSDENNVMCIKKHIMLYNDNDGMFHHTLKNILTFNDIDFHDDMSINITILKDGEVIKKTYVLKDVADHHINYFKNS